MVSTAGTLHIGRAAVLPRALTAVKHRTRPSRAASSSSEAPVGASSIEITRWVPTEPSGSGPRARTPRLSLSLSLSRSLSHARFALVRSFARCPKGFPTFIPSEFVDEIVEPAALDVLRNMQMAALDVEGLGAVKTAYVHAAYTGSSPAPPAFVLLHGFDSSMLEFRRFVQRLAPLGDVYAVDLAGWGFTDCGFAEEGNKLLGPTQKREHLKKFIQGVVGRPVTLLGTSLGGSVAIDFASEYQNVHVDRLVLVDAQGFIDGIGPMSKAPRFLSVLGVQVLKSVGLRQMANKMAYYAKERYATEDAMRIGRLHTHLDGWVDANVAFMSSGGYAVSTKLAGLELPCLVAWGRNDEILSPDNAGKFMEVLKDARLVWIDECGHVPALEQPDKLVEAIAGFLNEQ